MKDIWTDRLWTDGQTDGRRDGQANGRTNGWTNGQKDPLLSTKWAKKSLKSTIIGFYLDGRMDRQTYRHTDGQTDRPME